jgi:hypothetical protein
VQARARGGAFSGYASNQSGRIYLQGHFAGDQLQAAMAEVGSDGQPQLGTARTVTMERVQALGQAPPAGARIRLPAASPPSAAHRRQVDLQPGFRSRRAAA